MDISALDVVVLAAGKGTRMRSKLPKVLHQLAGRSLLSHVLHAAESLHPREVAVVVGHQAEDVRAAIDKPVRWVDQQEQNGTGHATQLALEGTAGDGVVLVLYGDVPLVNTETLKEAVESARKGNLAIVTAEFDDPAQLGRMVRNAKGYIERIVEFKDASEAERQIKEINSGILAAPASLLVQWLDRVKPNNAQGEYYLTDVVELAHQDDVQIDGILASDPNDVVGVNDRVQLAELERIFQRRQVEQLMREGVTVADPARLDIRGQIEAAEDVFIDINVVLEGQVSIGAGAHIGPGVVIKDATIGAGAQINAHTVVEDSTIADQCSVGPFARIRPGTCLDRGARVGNFVETKKTHMGAGSKANHLAYLGDATIGADCNIGAGTITCNYDGINKHPTHIGDGVFVGTNSTLVAPVTLEDNAFVAAGSTVTTTVGENDLAVGRAKQRNISGWTRPDQRPKKTDKE